MLSMEVPAEEFVGSSNDQTVVMRGKRTKRHRPASPFGLAVTCSSSSGGSASVSGGEVYESTEEEEDMANCLILLAQGGVSNGASRQAAAAHQEGCSSSRKFTEIMAATAAVKVGFYVYECKTCNRTFPSFQALGGHRASHKKSKTAAAQEVVAVAEEKTAGYIPVAIPIAAVAVDHGRFDDARNCHSPPLSLQFGNHGATAAAVNGKAAFNSNGKSNKTHECSICGSEFTSGQALGGHMRRHRTAAAPPATTTHHPTTAAVDNHNHHHHHRHEEEKKSEEYPAIGSESPGAGGRAAVSTAVQVPIQFSETVHSLLRAGAGRLPLLKLRGQSNTNTIIIF